MNHIKYYENFFQGLETPELGRIKSEIESIMENIDIDLNIEDWKFTPKISRFSKMSVVEINLVNDNSTKKILEEIRYIKLEIERIEGVGSTYTNIIISQNDNPTLRSIAISDGPNYITQLDNLNQKTWIQCILIHILFNSKLIHRIWE